MAPRLAGDFVRDRPLSLESTPSRIGSSACMLSCVFFVSFSLSELADGKASLARSASLYACPLALPAPSVPGLLSGRLKVGASLFLQFFLFSVWTCRLLLVLNCAFQVCVQQRVLARCYPGPILWRLLRHKKTKTQREPQCWKCTYSRHVKSHGCAEDVKSVCVYSRRRHVQQHCSVDVLVHSTLACVVAHEEGPPH